MDVKWRPPRTRDIQQVNYTPVEFEISFSIQSKAAKRRLRYHPRLGGNIKCSTA